MPARHFFLARQPILNRNHELAAYELLFRRGLENYAEVTDDMTASMTVIKHAFLDLGMDAALGGKTAFINISEDLLMSEVVEALPPEHVVLELLETVPITPAVVERCRTLKATGLRFALDDVVALHEPLERILPLLDIIKVDVLAAATEARLPVIREAMRHGVQLLAEKVDTSEQCEACRAEGFSLFQGYYFARPKILQGSTIPPSTMALLKILELIAADAESEELEEALKRTPDLAMRLLRLVNSAALGRTNKISTLHGAIRLLGRVQISRLVQIMIFTMGSDKALGTDPLVQTAIVRGRMMEGLAEGGGQPALKPRAFLLGMLSLADALFGETLESLAEHLALDETMRAALLWREGQLGRMLALVELSELTEDPAPPSAIQSLLADTHCPDLDVLNRLQLDALHWANTH